MLRFQWFYCSSWQAPSVDAASETVIASELLHINYIYRKKCVAQYDACGVMSELILTNFSICSLYGKWKYTINITPPVCDDAVSATYILNSLTVFGYKEKLAFHPSQPGVLQFLISQHFCNDCRAFVCFDVWAKVKRHFSVPPGCMHVVHWMQHCDTALCAERAFYSRQLPDDIYVWVQ